MYLAPTLNEIVFAVANATHTNTTHTGNTTNDLVSDGGIVCHGMR